MTEPARNVALPFTLIPPNVDLDHVSAFNEDGKRLEQLLSERNISAKHNPLVLGLFSVYNLLIRLGLFEQGQVAFPPHDNFDVEGYLAIGVTPEVVGILALLPYWAPDEDWKLGGDPLFVSDGAPALSYLGKADPDRRGPPPIEGFLKLEHFCLNNAFSQNRNYIYDSVNGEFTGLVD
jgi:hypothetical protein